MQQFACYFLFGLDWTWTYFFIIKLLKKAKECRKFSLENLPLYHHKSLSKLCTYLRLKMLKMQSQLQHSRVVLFSTQYSSKCGNGMDSVRQTTQNNVSIPFSVGSSSKNVSICPSTYQKTPRWSTYFFKKLLFSSLNNRKKPMN